MINCFYFKEHNGQNLLDIEGHTPGKYAKRLSRVLWTEEELCTSRVVDINAPERRTEREAFKGEVNESKIKLLKSKIRLFL